jgi:hypothetical protein
MPFAAAEDATWAASFCGVNPWGKFTMDEAVQRERSWQAAEAVSRFLFATMRAERLASGEQPGAGN